ncbi:MAG: YitT family protein [Bacteroidales bacterium]|nr:YitT family protein [Bacteroidales bacterium]
MTALSKKKILGTVWDYVVLTFSMVLYSIAWGCFMVPNNFIDGGLTGLCAIIQFATGGLIPLSASYFVLNALLIVAGFIVLGKGFGVRTVFCILVSSACLSVIPDMEFLHSTEGHFFYVKESVLLPIIAGMLEAVAISMAFSRGGSTGGTDIITLIVNKYWPVSPGKVFLFTDFVIVTSLLFLPGKTFSDVVYGYLTMISFAFVIDYILMGRKSTVKVLVFSVKYAEIADYIISMDRGVTVVKAMGWYSKQDRDMLLILIRRSQLHELTEKIKQIDKNAFVSVSPASGVYGEGFDEIKTGIKRKKKNKE